MSYKPFLVSTVIAQIFALTQVALGLETGHFTIFKHGQGTNLVELGETGVLQVQRIQHQALGVVLRKGLAREGTRKVVAVECQLVQAAIAQVTYIVRYRSCHVVVVQI